MAMTVPNTITSLRMVLIPVFIGAFYLPTEAAPAIATFIFWLAAISDWFDGYLARKLDQQSLLGAFIDPLADKLMVIVALIMLIAKHPDNNWILFSAIIIIAREIIVSSLREWMGSMGKGDMVVVSFVGKAKTAGQMFALLFLIYQNDLFGLPSFIFGEGLLVWAAILTLLSLAKYLAAAWSTIKSSS
jgi:CDP-diacylglycerol--glycerol-3-phosphate 3-phosphatidyltransferase